MRKYTWILFDADQTLFDYTRAEEQALSATFSELNIPFREEYAGLYHTYNSQVWGEFEQGRIGSVELRVERFRRMLAAAGIAGSAEVFSRTYLPNLARGSFLNPGAEELVAALRPLFKLALITNGLSDVQRPRLAASPLAGVFEVVAISEEIGAAKPHQAYFEAVFERLGNPGRETALVVGDSLTSDIQGGLDFGLDTCWYNPHGLPLDSRFPPTYQISMLAELLPIVLDGEERPG